MAQFPQTIHRLIELFNRLPGIGTKTSERFVFYLLKQPREVLDQMSEALTELKQSIQLCQRCFTYSESPLCSICSNPRRDTAQICVVADPPDLWAIEQTREYQGVYHVLGGVINQVEGVGPEQLRLEELIRRAKDGTTREVIIATNPDVEGETTAHVVVRALQPTGVRVSRIARGLPTGADIEYADPVTLTNALKGRTGLNK